MGRRLPAFTLEEYGELLDRLRAAGYELLPVTRLPDVFEHKVLFLRHDIDLHIDGVERMAEIEARAGVAATYFVPVGLHFNPLYVDNRNSLRRILALGHELGLHYDLSAYPESAADAAEVLDLEIAFLERLAGVRIHTISMHEPHKGLPDSFLQTDSFVHPHDPRYQHGLRYISDSCRAWRDESLLDCFSDQPPHRVMLTTHPELWLGQEVDRMGFLHNELVARGTEQHHRYFEETVRRTWEAHPGPRLHDARTRGERSGS